MRHKSDLPEKLCNIPKRGRLASKMVKLLIKVKYSFERCKRTRKLKVSAMNAILHERHQVRERSVQLSSAAPRRTRHRQLRVVFDEQVIAETTKGSRLIKTGYPPVYYSVDDVDTEFLFGLRR